MSMGQIVQFKGKAEKITRTRVDTISFTPEDVRGWEVHPNIQRPLTMNKKFKEVVEFIKESGGVVPGMITLAIISGKTYRIDGNHRLTAFLQSGCSVGYADVRYCYLDSIADGGVEFQRLNVPISRMKPDDILRSLEMSVRSIATLRIECKIVGYSPKKGKGKVGVSMSMILRAWAASAKDTPANHGIAESGHSIARQIGDDDLNSLIRFTNLCDSAWGNEPGSMKLWCALNLTLCMWMYRRIVMSRYSIKSAQINDDMFRKCLLELSADGQYADWLVGRGFGERNRVPCYNKIKELFARRMYKEINRKVSLPQPDWVKG